MNYICRSPGSKQCEANDSSPGKPRLPSARSEIQVLATGGNSLHSLLISLISSLVHSILLWSLFVVNLKFSHIISFFVDFPFRNMLCFPEYFFSI